MTKFSLLRSRNALKISPIALAAAGLLSACSSTDAMDPSASAMGKAKGRVTKEPVSSPTPTPTPTSSSSAVYDASVGSGVDGGGFANLPLRTGALRYFVNSATGSAANDCNAARNPATPMTTITAARSCLRQGFGDQMLVAEGTSYSGQVLNFTGHDGYDPTYPTVIQSYDPADPLNEAKYGRAASPNRPVIKGIDGNNPWLIGGPGTTPNYVALRGMDFNPGNIAGQNIQMFSAGNNVGANYVLIENNLFRYTQLTFQYDYASEGTKFIFRRNSVFGAWSPTAHAQGLYIDGANGVTIEDNIFYHNGWKIGASRDDTPANGGTTVFRHSLYTNEKSYNVVVRRNLFADPSATGCSCRGDATITENLFLDVPIPINAGLGVQYSTQRPDGVDLQISYNAILGDADINSANPRGEAVSTGNGRSGSSFHHNLIARSRNPSGVNVVTFNPTASENVPSYMDFHHNVEYQWAAPGQVIFNSGTYAGTQIHATYSYNVWSDSTSGTNSNNGSKSYPNPYTAAQLFAALGYSDKQALIDYVILHPEANVQQTARALLFAGYGVP